MEGRVTQASSKLGLIRFLERESNTAPQYNPVDVCEMRYGVCETFVKCV
jgi:hypothetical protein